MVLSEEVKKQITDIIDSEEFKKTMYEGLSEETRKALGQFYTPAKLCIQMIEKYSAESFSGLSVLDPACGSGNLLIAMLIAGADSDKVFGNDYDDTAVKLCRKRLNRACDILGKPHIRDWQIHQGNALQKRCITDFSEEYLNGSNHYMAKYIDDRDYAQSNKSWRWENEHAKDRLEEAAEKKAKAERDAAKHEQAKAFIAQYEQLTLFDF